MNGKTNTKVRLKYPKYNWNNAQSVSVAQLVAGYTCPSDGVFLCVFFAASVSGASAAVSQNGLTVCYNTYNTTRVYSSNQCMVSKGDLMKCSTSSVAAAFTFVPAVADWDNIVNQKLPKLDWANKITVTATMLNNGYTVSRSGFLVGYARHHVHQAPAGSTYITVNGVNTTYTSSGPNVYPSNGTFNLLVAKGDYIKATNSVLTDSDSWLYLIPYK